MAAEQQQAPIEVAAPEVDAPPTKTFIIEGSDGERIEISELAVKQSKTLSDLVENLGSSGDEDTASIPLSNISGDILRKVVIWCEHHKGEEIPKEDESIPKRVETPDWDRDFLNVDEKVLFDLIIAANYLDIKQLMNYSCKKVADMAKGKSPEELRIIYMIPTDEEAAAQETAALSLQ